MILLIDLGNTRLKIAYYDKGNLVSLGAIPVSELHSNANRLEALQIGQYQFKSCYIASVGSQTIMNHILAIIKDNYLLNPIFLQSSKSCCGLTNGYKKPEQLGIDRWLTLLGCVHDSKAYLVVDAGSALTIDVVNNFEHLGGFITPGLSMMRKSLFQNTQILRDKEPYQVTLNALAKETSSAIYDGTLNMMVAYINRLVKEMEKDLQCSIECIGTGGDFSQLDNFLEVPFKHYDDLVFQGMKKIIESV